MDLLNIRLEAAAICQMKQKNVPNKGPSFVLGVFSLLYFERDLGMFYQTNVCNLELTHFLPLHICHNMESRLVPTFFPFVLFSFDTFFLETIVMCEACVKGKYCTRYEPQENFVPE